jgi:thiol-disulfide isomerase/thioredoxin
MRVTLAILALSLTSAAVAAGGTEPAPMDSTAPALEHARQVLDEVRVAYRNAGAFRETMDLTLTLPDGRRETRRSTYGVDGRGGSFLSLAHAEGEVLRIVARADHMVGLQIGVNQRYAQVPYSGDFAASLRAMGGDQAQMAAPPGIVAAQGGGPDVFFAAFRLGVLAPLRIEGVTSVPEKSLVQIDLKSDNGSMTIGIDSATHRLVTIAGGVGQGAQQIKVSGSFTREPLGTSPDVPDLTGSTVVPTLGAIQESGFPLGKQAPQITLRTLDGRPVQTSEFAGSVVVLDFWATWCVPCWTALGHTAELARWAQSSGLPIKVYAVDTLESDAALEPQQQKVREFLRAKKIDVPVLLDVGGEGFKAFHNPGLPSLVILDAEGHLARYHSGLLQQFEETVRADVQAVVDAKRLE